MLFVLRREKFAFCSTVRREKFAFCSTVRREKIAFRSKKRKEDAFYVMITFPVFMKTDEKK